MRLRDPAHLLGFPQWLTFVLCRASALTVAVPFGICTRFSILRRALNGLGDTQTVFTCPIQNSICARLCQLDFAKTVEKRRRSGEKDTLYKKTAKKSLHSPGGSAIISA